MSFFQGAQNDRLDEVTCGGPVALRACSTLQVSEPALPVSGRRAIIVVCVLCVMTVGMVVSLLFFSSQFI